MDDHASAKTKHGDKGFHDWRDEIQCCMMKIWGEFQMSFRMVAIVAMATISR